MKWLTVAVLLLFGGVPAAFAWSHGSASGGAGGACPFGATLGDGCPGALSTATQQTSGLFTSGPTNGQSYQTASFTGSVSGTTLTVSGVTGTINPNGHDTLCPASATCAGIPAGTTIVSGSGTTWTLSANLGTVGSEAMTTQFRPNWNVAGVDYPVGAPPSNTLTDPQTLPTCSGVTHPLCINSGVAHEVDIVAANSGSNVVVDHYDFSLHGGYQLVLTYADTGNFTLTNSKFQAGTNFQSGGDIYTSAAGGNGSCGSTMFNSDNPSTHTIAGTTTIANVEFDGKADTGSATVHCPGSDGTGGSPAVFNIWSTVGGNAVNVTYSYFHDYNPRIQFAYGATIKYSLFGANNYNTVAHGELTAFNECPSCSGTSTIDMEYNTVVGSNAYCGGQTAPIFLGSGNNSPQVTDATIKNNTFITNGCQLNVSSNSSPSHAGCAGTVADGANCQITFTTVDGATSNGGLGGFNLCIPGNASSNMTCPATLTTQISGTTNGGGVWRYSGELTGSTNFSLVIGLIGPAGAFMTGESYRNIDSENNYVDGTGSANASVDPQFIGDCSVAGAGSTLHPASGSITSANNKWMGATTTFGIGVGSFAFAPCEKFSEGFIVGTTSGTTLSPAVDAVFTGNINVDAANELHVTAMTSGTIQVGDTDSVIDSAGHVQRGTQIIGTQISGTPGGIGFYNITNNTQTVASQTMSAAQIFGTVNSGSRTDTLVGSGVGAGITVTSGVCSSAGCATSYGLSSSPGTLSNRNFVVLVP